MLRMTRVVIVGLYAARTWLRNNDWRHREAFYGAMVRDAPTNPKVSEAAQARAGKGGRGEGEGEGLTCELGMWHVAKLRRAQAHASCSYTSCSG